MILFLLLALRGWLRALLGQATSFAALQAENLFLRKQLALFIERNQRPRRPGRWDRVVLATVSRYFAWADALVVVKPATLIRWHREGFRLLWRRKSRPTGRRMLPKELRQLIRQIGADNPRWGQDEIRNHLCTKLGLRVSARTVAKYLDNPWSPNRRCKGDQRWSTFVRNHAKAILACDFFITITASFRILYGFVVMEIGSRKILHFCVTPNPTAEWTFTQLNNAFFDIEESHYRFLIHDRSPYFAMIDRCAKGFGLGILKTPVRAPRANAYCERLIGTIRRDCLDYLIPVNERHLRMIMREFVEYYNSARPHSSLGPGFPTPRDGLPANLQDHRHHLPAGARVIAKPILGGLHHDYSLDEAA